MIEYVSKQFNDYSQVEDLEVLYQMAILRNRLNKDK